MLKPAFESLSPQSGQSFLMRRFREKAFPSPYHYHPELELTHIIKGEGQRYVGSDMASFAAGDLVMLGPDLPHCWKTERAEKEDINAISIVLQFKEDCFGPGFFNRKEMRLIKTLFDRSAYGICFKGSTAQKGGEWMLQLETETDPFKKMISFFQTFQMLAGSEEYVLLNNETTRLLPSADQSRINKVLAYIVDHFRTEISLEKAAEIAGMTTTAFCKFFKRSTRKTFIETVTEYRINYATQQLVYTDHPVSQISFDSGFGDVSHFYKTFRQRKKLSPLQYRNKIMKVDD